MLLKNALQFTFTEQLLFFHFLKSLKPRIKKSSLIYIYLREIILPSFIYTIFDISRYDTYREH